MTSSSSWSQRPVRSRSRRPILFVHGLLHSGACWSEAWCDFFIRRGLAAHRVNLPGRGGAGAGRRHLRWTSLNEFADSIVETAAEFDTPPILVGHSLGALLIQMRLRQLNPAAVILLAPTQPAAFRWAAWRHFLRHPRRFLQVHWRRRPRLAIASSGACREWFFCDSTPEDTVVRCFAGLEEESYRVCLELLLRPKVVWQAPPGVPVLVLGAGLDACVPCQAVDAVARHYGVEAEYFEDMGHDLMLEPGWTRVAGRILSWLRGLELVPFPRTVWAGAPAASRPNGRDLAAARPMAVELAEPEVVSGPRAVWSPAIGARSAGQERGSPPFRV